MAIFQGWGDYQLSEDRTAGVKVCGIIFLLLNEELSVFHFSLFHSSVFTFHLFLLTQPWSVLQDPEVDPHQSAPQSWKFPVYTHLHHWEIPYQLIPTIALIPIYSTQNPLEQAKNPKPK